VRRWRIVFIGRGVRKRRSVREFEVWIWLIGLLTLSRAGTVKLKVARRQKQKIHRQKTLDRQARLVTLKSHKQMVNFVINDLIRSHAEKARNDTKLETQMPELHKSLAKLDSIDSLPHSILKQLSEYSDLPLKRLLLGAEMQRIPPPPRIRSPELEIIMNKLKREADEKEYQRMVRGIGGVSSDSKWAVDFKDLQRESRAVGRWVAAIANVLFSLVGMGVTGYYLGYQLSFDPAIVRTSPCQNGLTVG